jgi:pimeloyl-ACP methyl ester carboxylesterase
MAAMMSTRPTKPGPRLRLARALGMLATASCLVLVAAARADLIILKDGFALHGKVLRQKTTAFEPGAGLMEFAKLNGFFWVEDEARRIIFSMRQVNEEGVENKNLDREADFVRLTRQVRNLDNFRLQPNMVVTEIGELNSKWERTVTIEAPNSRFQTGQRIVLLTPHAARVESLRYVWAPCYLTSEFPPDKLRTLLYEHPDLKPTGKPDDAAKRFRAARFLQQANLYDLAEKEYQSIAKDFPDQKDKVETSLTNLRKLRLLAVLDVLEQAHKAGRHQWAQGQIARVATEDLDSRGLTRLQTLKAFYEKAVPSVQLARRFLKELPGRLTSPGTRDLLEDAATTIQNELTLESVGRLEAFVNLAKQAERDSKAEQTPEQLLSLAVTGWLLGNVSAEAKVESAVRLWRARQLLLEYQRTAAAGARQQVESMLEQSGVPFDELDRVIRNAPPPEAYPLLGAQWPVAAGCYLQGTAVAAGLWPATLAPWPLATSALSAGTGAITLRLTTDGLPPALAISRRRGVRYLLQVPPEYHPGRAYPVLFVLHGAGGSNEDMLKRWSLLAAHHGYLLAAPEWGSGFRQPYDYTHEEQAAVLDVLRDLRRRFQVDSDRVFLFGWGEGGNMAYDVGLSHPDLFAGVMPMAARPRYFAKAYWKNGQHLPFYVVEGDKQADSKKDNVAQFEHWVRSGFPSLYVQYKGRGEEWFGGELTYLFDWMGRKKRPAMPRQIGTSSGGGPFSEEFQALRTTDDHFYWLSVTDLRDRNTNEAGRWRANVVPGSLHGRIGEGNQLNVVARGFRKVTVWFGQGMIDFDKNVTVYVNLQAKWANRKITPNVTTLLEDFYQRGDRQQLFWAKAEFTP